MSKTESNVSSLALRPSEPLPAPILQVLDGSIITEEMARQALATVFRGLPTEAIALAFVKSKLLGVNPLLEHVVLIKTREKVGTEFIDKYRPFITLAGRLVIAQRALGKDGKRLWGGIKWFTPKLIDDEYHVVCQVWRQDIPDRPAAEYTDACKRLYGNGNVNPNAVKIARGRAARNALRFAFAEIMPDEDYDLENQVRADEEGIAVPTALANPEVPLEEGGDPVSEVAQESEVIVDGPRGADVVAVQEGAEEPPAPGEPPREPLVEHVRALLKELPWDDADKQAFVRGSAIRYRIKDVKRWQELIPIEGLLKMISQLEGEAESSEYQGELPI